MGLNLTQKIIQAHLVEGEMVPGKEIAIRIDQTLSQDATGTMAFLQFEAMGLPRAKSEVAVQYVDHNMLQEGFENADDHRFLQTFASKHGIYYSRPGNGICHQVHLERFGAPGKTLLGCDSHTPTSGGLGSLAIGAGGLDVAVAMGGGAFYLMMPRVVGIRLTGKLQPWCSGKDIILEVLRILTVKGGVGKVMEYHGPGVASLTVPDRATTTNMGAELGATTSIFPSDEQTRLYLKAQGREHSYVPLAPAPDATYDELVEINLDELTSRIACPQSPDNVKAVTELEGLKVDQVCIGSCTNSSFRDLMTAAMILRGKKVHPSVSVTLTPGSRQVYMQIAQSGALADFIAAGARILESACGPCIGKGQAPGSGQVSLRTFNRNFPGRSGGGVNDLVYLCSPEVAAVAALTGVVTDPRKLGAPPQINLPEHYLIDDELIYKPSDEPEKVVVQRGPNIAPLPIADPLPAQLKGEVLLKVGDNITTDHISPAGQWLSYRSNVPKYSEATFTRIDATFPQRAKDLQATGVGGLVVGGSNYGQGSSREHAALCPMYLGVKAVIAKSFARIHRTNLINFGILPLVFKDEADCNGIDQGDRVEIADCRDAIPAANEITVKNVTKGTAFIALHNMTPREVKLTLAGGLLNSLRGDGKN